MQRKMRTIADIIDTTFFWVFNKVKKKTDKGKITNKTILPRNAVLKIYCPEKKD